ncbi:MAG: TetR/AcrR family transcriptional regulator [Bacteroidota bacterium]
MDTKQHILQSAFILFLGKSYDAVTLNEICKVTGLSKGAFYHHYRSKEELFREVIDKFVFANLFFEKAEFDGKSTLQSTIDSFLEHLESKISKLTELTGLEFADPDHFQLILEASRSYPGFSEQIKKREQKNSAFWEHVILKAQKEGEIRGDIDPLLLNGIMLAIGSSLFRHILHQEPFSDAVNLLRRQYNQLYRLIKA